MTGIKRDCQCKQARHVHGTEAAYSRDDCRCLPCALARQQYLIALHAGLPTERQTVPITATRLRLRALTWMGWSPRELAGRLGTSPEIVQRHRSGMAGSDRYGDDAAVLRRTHDAVAAVYDELWDVPSIGPHALRMRNLARRNGWLPPLALDLDDDMPVEQHPDDVNMSVPEFIDEIAVEQAVAGRPVRLTSAERSVAVGRLTDMGFSARQIAARLGVTSRTVTRRRAA